MASKPKHTLSRIKIASKDHIPLIFTTLNCLASLAVGYTEHEPVYEVAFILSINAITYFCTKPEKIAPGTKY